MADRSYKGLEPSKILSTAVDFIKCSQPLPEELREELDKLDMLTTLEQGDINED